MTDSSFLVRCALAGVLCVGAIVGLALVRPVAAAAPMVKTPAPGFYRMMLGDFEVTALSDGTIDLPADQILTNTTPAEIRSALARSFEATPVETSVNAYLVNTGTKLVLIDTGASALFGPTLGNLVTNLQKAGYQPEQVDEIYLTHMHGDHAGGLMVNGKMTFPHALVRADAREAGYWLSDANLQQASGDVKESMQAASDCLSPYVKAGRFASFDGDSELVPGIRSVAAYGHTPGHTAYAIESKGQRLVVWGDLMHVAALQFANPAVTIAFDTDAAAATRSRQRIFADAAAKGYLVAGAHLSFPGIGHLRAEGGGYVFVPVDYTVVR